MFDGACNVRDIGGLPTSRGGLTRPGVLYRSGDLSTLTPTGLDEFAASGIGAIVDLRTPVERSLAPDRLPHTRRYRVVHVPMRESVMAGVSDQVSRTSALPTRRSRALGSDRLPSLVELYLVTLSRRSGAIAQLARLVSQEVPDRPSAVLVHSALGKDRVGVAIAVLLAAVGVQRAAVIADYAASVTPRSGPWIRAARSRAADVRSTMTPAMGRLLLTRAPAIERALSWLDDEVGGAGAYLRGSGLAEDELAALRARLTV